MYGELKVLTYMLQDRNFDYKTVELLIDNKVINPDQKDLYLYGIKQLRRFVLNIATSLMVGLVFNMVFESILFSAFFIPLRQFAGGYHARTPKICYVSSIGLLVVALLIIKCLPINSWALLTIAVITLVVLCIFAPSESENKPLSIQERKTYKKYSLVIFLIESLLALGTYYLGDEIYSKCIFVAMLTVNSLLLLSKKNNESKSY